MGRRWFTLRVCIASLTSRPRQLSLVAFILDRAHRSVDAVNEHLGRALGGLAAASVFLDTLLLVFLPPRLHQSLKTGILLVEVMIVKPKLFLPWLIYSRHQDIASFSLGFSFTPNTTSLALLFIYLSTAGPCPSVVWLFFLGNYGVILALQSASHSPDVFF